MHLFYIIVPTRLLNMVPENMENGFEESSPLTGTDTRKMDIKKGNWRRIALPVLVGIFIFASAFIAGSVRHSNKSSSSTSTTSSIASFTEADTNTKIFIGDVGGPAKADSSCTGDLSATPITTTCSCDNTKPVLMGVDVVAYFQMEENSSNFVQGSSDYSTQLNGYTFYFSSQENMDTFTTSPWDYAPQFGAYCSYGVSEETTDMGFDWEPSTLGPAINPAIWEIVNNKLYLFYTEDARDKWNQVSTNYQDGEERWSGWFGDLESGVFNTACYAINLQDGDSNNN